MAEICLAWPTLNLSVRAVFIIGAIRTDATQACDAIAHVEQHDLQRVSVHAPLIRLSSTLHVLHHPPVLSLCLYYERGGERDTE